MLTKELNDVLKDAQTVTSLSSADNLTVISSDGTPKKVSKATLLNDVGDFGVNLVTGSLKKYVSGSALFGIAAGTPVVISFESYEAVSGETPSIFSVINRCADDSNPQYLSVTPGATLSLVSRGKVCLYPNQTGYSSNKGYFHKLKIEKGYSATKWSPAPEDFIALLGGGGKTLSFNILRNTKERRVA